MINPDIFGYYTVGQFKTYRKLEAIEEHFRTGTHPTWVFNDDVYSSVDCTVEPSETLEELYRQRAQRLREKYDYLVLWYSGGADSDAVLNAFVDNDILIDEVVSFVNYAATSNKFDPCNGEIFNVAEPKIRLVQKKYPSIKYRVLDICQPMVDYFLDKTMSQDWMYDLNTIATGFVASRQNIHTTVPDWVSLFDQGKNVAFISGTDKPRLHQTDDGNYHFRFMDIFDNSITAGQQAMNHQWFNHEFFFWSPDSPTIVIKQAHIIKKFLRHASDTNPWFTKKANGLAFTNINNKKYWVTLDSFHRLIYPGWKPVLYQVKPLSPVFSLREDWFRKLPDNDQAFKHYKSGLLARWKLVPDYWKNGNSLYQGYKACVSRSYNLGS